MKRFDLFKGSYFYAPAESSVHGSFDSEEEKYFARLVVSDKSYFVIINNLGGIESLKNDDEIDVEFGRSSFTLY